MTNFSSGAWDGNDELDYVESLIETDTIIDDSDGLEPSELYYPI